MRVGDSLDSSGYCSRQRAVASRHRGWKWHPPGGFAGDGVSPGRRTMLTADDEGFGLGTADSNARV